MQIGMRIFHQLNHSKLANTHVIHADFAVYLLRPNPWLEMTLLLQFRIQPYPSPKTLFLDNLSFSFQMDRETCKEDKVIPLAMFIWGIVDSHVKSALASIWNPCANHILLFSMGNLYCWSNDKDFSDADL